MKNIHVLPTDILKIDRKTQTLWTNSIGQFLHTHSSSENLIPYNIYITNSEAIKEGDWYFITESISKCESKYEANDLTDICKKIILTTDPQLIADGVQAIDDNFLEWFVKNPSCEKVETFIDTMGCSLESCDGNPCVNYKIIIPQEEPKQETLEEAVEDYTDTPSLDNIKLAFRNGAKWQQEAILDLLKVNGYEDDPIFDLITEQFKKK
jgi:hypothetical protein